MIKIGIQIIENSLTLRVLACAAFLMPTILFYITVIVAVKDASNFKRMIESESEEKQQQKERQTVREKKWVEVIEFSTLPIKKNRIEDYWKIRDSSLKKLKSKTLIKKKGYIKHELIKFYGKAGIDEEKRKEEYKEIIRMLPIYRRSGPLSKKEKLINGAIALIIGVIIMIAAI